MTYDEVLPLVTKPVLKHPLETDEENQADVSLIIIQQIFRTKKRIRSRKDSHPCPACSTQIEKQLQHRLKTLEALQCTQTEVRKFLLCRSVGINCSILCNNSFKDHDNSGTSMYH